MHTLLLNFTFAVLAALVGSPVSACQDAQGSLKENIVAKLEALKEQKEFDGSALQQNYSQALQALERAQAQVQRLEEYRVDEAGIRQLSQQIRSQLDSASFAYSEYDDSADLSITSIDELKAESQSRLAAAQLELEEIAKQIQFRSFRIRYIPEELGLLEGLRAQIEEGLRGEFQTRESEALHALWLAKKEEYLATSRLLEAESLFYLAQQDLMILKRELATQQEVRASQDLEHWTRELEKKQAQSAALATQKIEGEVRGILAQRPSLSLAGKEVLALANRRVGKSGLLARVAGARADLESTLAQLKEVEKRHLGARRRISVAGLTKGSGVILRRDNAWLENNKELEKREEGLKDDLARFQVELIELEEAAALKIEAAKSIGERILDLGVNSSDGAQFEAARRLLQIQDQLELNLQSDLTTLTTLLLEHRVALSSLQLETEAYRGFIEQKILWIKSSETGFWQSMRDLPTHAGEWILAIVDGEIATLIWEAFSDHRVSLVLLNLLVAGLLLKRKWILNQLLEIGRGSESLQRASFARTLAALMWTALASIPFPVLLWQFGSVLSSDPSSSLAGFGQPITWAAKIWWLLACFRLLLTKGKGTPSHFRWKAATIQVLRDELRWFMPLVVISSCFVLVPDTLGPEAWVESIGRVGFIVNMTAFAVFGWRCFGALLDESDAKTSSKTGAGNHSESEGKTTSLLQVMAFALPMALIITASLGYYFTAIQLSDRLQYSLVFGLILIISHATLLQWLYVARRKIAASQSLESQVKTIAESGGDQAIPASEVDSIDLSTVNLQTQKLFKSALLLTAIIGMVFIWGKVFPALDNLNQIQIWPTWEVLSPLEDATEKWNDAGSPVAQSAADVAQEDLSIARVTLGSLLVAIVILAGTFIFAKNLPALLELAILQRLPIDNGGRYAISTIARYLILLAGITACSTVVGIGWNQVQWLVAALTFGLAFGLQEIFANFISGIIILFERPVRVGDIVTVGDTEGQVTQLRMRATTIQDWNRRELLVPNKEFITQRVINWSLTDSVTRLVIPVGIAYGSDTELARETLLECAAKEELVLSEPPPQAIFKRFGESSLDLELRVFLSHREVWPTAVNALHSSIDAAFRRHGIEIAFPQRDLHIRSFEGETQVEQGPAHGAK